MDFERNAHFLGWSTSLMEWLMRRTFAILVLLCCCGCGKSDGVQRATVQGTVTLDGIALPQGSIVFCPCGNTKGPKAGGVVKDGHYSIATSKGPVVGTNHIKIEGFKETGRKVHDRSGATVDEIIHIVPKCYNSDSTLESELKSGQNILDYELTSKKK
jgi:hypothetical protein